MMPNLKKMCATDLFYSTCLGVVLYLYASPHIHPPLYKSEDHFPKPIQNYGPVATAYVPLDITVTWRTNFIPPANLLMFPPLTTKADLTDFLWALIRGDFSTH